MDLYADFIVKMRSTTTSTIMVLRRWLNDYRNEEHLMDRSIFIASFYETSWDAVYFTYFNVFLRASYKTALLKENKKYWESKT